MPDAPPPEPRSRPRGRGGRTRDPSRDADLLNATLKVLAEVGYERMTMDAVAAQAHSAKTTMYRRWESKPHLVLDALTHMERNEAQIEDPPDTGTLRGDLLALYTERSTAAEQRKLRVLRGVMSMTSSELDLGEIARTVIIEPWTTVVTELMHRAVARGEISADVDLPTLSRLIPSMAAYRALIEEKSVDQAFLLQMIDTVLLPAAGITPHPTHHAHDS